MPFREPEPAPGGYTESPLALRRSTARSCLSNAWLRQAGCRPPTSRLPLRPNRTTAGRRKRSWSEGARCCRSIRRFDGEPRRSAAGDGRGGFRTCDLSRVKKLRPKPRLRSVAHRRRDRGAFGRPRLVWIRLDWSRFGRNRAFLPKGTARLRGPGCRADGGSGCGFLTAALAPFVAER